MSIKAREISASILDDPGGQISGQGRTVPDLARSAGISERNFARVFPVETGLPPARFVKAARLTRAKGLLETSGEPLDRIAERLGYGATDGLFRAFQKGPNISPGAYRARF